MKKNILRLGLFLGTLVPSVVFCASYENKELIPGQESTGNFIQYLENLYNFSVAIAAILAIFMIAYGAFVYIFSSAGNVSKMSDSKDIIKNAIFGLILVFLAFLILFIINPDLISTTITGPESIINKILK